MLSAKIRRLENFQQEMSDEENEQDFYLDCDMMLSQAQDFLMGELTLNTDEDEDEDIENQSPVHHVPGRLVDYYLRGIAKSIHNKLNKGRESGAVSPIKELIPWQVWRKVVERMHEYGAEVKKTMNDADDGDDKQLVCYIRKQDAAERIFSHTRLGGKNYLMKITAEKRSRYSYSSNTMACVIISNLTPITFTYLNAEQELYVSFFIQRYDSKGSAHSPCLQALVNISTSTQA